MQGPVAASVATVAIDFSYLLVAFLFIMGLKAMSSPVTARRGIVVAGVGMLIGTLMSFLYPGMGNFPLMLLAIAIGGGLAWWSGRIVAMTDMPQMIALYNGMGGGAAAAIAAVELLRMASGAAGAAEHGPVVTALAAAGAFIGGVSFSGSLIAFGKLQGLIKRSFRFKGQQFVNLLITASTIGLGAWIVATGDPTMQMVVGFFALALVLGVTMTLPIGGADMPVVISLYNAFTGLAVAFEGFVLENAAMIIAGIVVGSAGTLLTQLMAKAMNRSLANVLFSGFGEGAAAAAEGVSGALKPIEPSDAGVMMAFAQKVIVIPGYGMAVAQAQHKVWELCQLLIDKGVMVRFAIHPVAGRMPGHMNVLLAEAGVPYDLISDLDEINAEFDTADVALVIGANDVVNPVARTDKSSPIYGMPILNADKAKNVLVIKRGQGAGFSGIENHLFYLDNTRMVYGDAQKVAAELIQAVKAAG
ncbi:MAG TPA: NAD(P)(+) transhydrogenase (Re/Si-specific) subunit beta [Steroidobacteraceae bacterium]|nr:NAD(P)(+) transhydrogenase (Re/Si-specific) subunit beta [Steroidobacteraceae bacterium]